MQWLIDLIIEAIGIPPCYIDRGDPAAADFTIADFNITNAWTMLDLSAIVPEGATAVNCSFTIKATSVNRKFRLRRHGNVNDIAMGKVRTQVANVLIGDNCTVAVDADRKVDYWRELIGINFCNMNILGWWF